MNRNLTKIIGAGALTLSMALLPFTLSASAQVNQPGVEVEPRPGIGVEAYEDDSFDWGWLGLIGLLGLAGLAGRGRREEPTRYRDPNAVGGPTYRE